MLRNLLVGLFMLVAQHVKAQAAQECMKVTDEVGVVNKVSGVDFLSNMDDLAYKLEERVLYMRTSDINVCFDD